MEEEEEEAAAGVAVGLNEEMALLIGLHTTRVCGTSHIDSHALLREVDDFSELKFIVDRKSNLL